MDINSIYELGYVTENETHFYNLGLTPQNTIKKTAHTESETLKCLKDLSNTPFNKDINNVVLIRDGSLGKDVKFGTEKEALYTKEMLSLMDKVLDNLNKSSNTKNTSVLIVDKGVIVDNTSQFYGFALRQNDKLLIENNEISRFGCETDYVSYSHAEKNISIEVTFYSGEKNRPYISIIDGSEKIFLPNIPENDYNLIRGDIDTIFGQAGALG